MIKTTTLSTPAEITLDVPDEPPSLSVVLSKSGRAWQRVGRAWYSAGTPSVIFPQAGGIAVAWAHLLLHHGPVRIIYTPEVRDES